MLLLSSSSRNGFYGLVPICSTWSYCDELCSSASMSIPRGMCANAIAGAACDTGIDPAIGDAAGLAFTGTGVVADGDDSFGSAEGERLSSGVASFASCFNFFLALSVSASGADAYAFSRTALSYSRVVKTFSSAS